MGTAVEEQVASLETQDDVKKKRFFRRPLGIAVLMTLVLVVAAAGAGAYILSHAQPPDQAFIAAVESGNVQKAVKVYNQQVKGRADVESTWKETVSNYIAQISDDFTNKTISVAKADERLTTIAQTGAETGFFKTEAEAAQKTIDELSASRIAFTAAESDFYAGHYIKAMGEYAKVIEADADYVTAQSQIKAAHDKYVGLAIDKAQSLQEAHNYTDAGTTLDAALADLPGDAELVAAAQKNQADQLAYLIGGQDISVDRAYVYKYDGATGLSAMIKNNTQKTVTAYTVAFLAWNVSGTPLKLDGSNTLKKGDTDCEIQAGQGFGAAFYWEADAAVLAKIQEVKACVVNAQYSDGSTWANPYFGYWLQQYQGKTIKIVKNT